MSLQRWDPSFRTPGQQFVLRMQNNTTNGFNVIHTGVAFINLFNSNGILFNSVTSQGLKQQLVMQRYDTYSVDKDAWIIAEAKVNNVTGIRITSPQNSSWSWNAWGGTGEINEPIYLNDDTNNNSIWIVTFAPLLQTESEQSNATEAPEPATAG